ncbi:MAG: hypothetical protein Q7R76_02830 [Candidatus Woesearchaeota archaeon]|nr:hypothetical protein [Candidatus Woesearchaeota archaeon]
MKNRRKSSLERHSAMKIPSLAKKELQELEQEDAELPTKKQLEQQNKAFMGEASHASKLFTKLAQITGLQRKKRR